MMLLLLPLVLVLVFGFSWLATRSNKHVFRALWVSIFVMVSSLASILIGFGVGKMTTSNAVGVSQRYLGAVFTEIKEELHAGHIQTATAQIDLLEAKWYSLNFVDDKTDGGRIPVNVFLMEDFWTIKKVPDVTPASGVPAQE